MIKAQFLCPWYSKGEVLSSFPPWFNFYLLTCSKNIEFEWVFFSDSNSFPCDLPPNIIHHKISKKDFVKLVFDKTGINLPVHSIPSKLCDLRPAYGSIFSDFLDAPMWGHCDFDIFWGNLSSFVKDRYMDKFDILTSRGHSISGHFSLFKNLKDNSFYYESISEYKNILELSKSEWGHIDEVLATLCYKQLQIDGKIKILWSCGRSNYPWHVVHFWTHLKSFSKIDPKSLYAKNCLTKWEDCKDLNFYKSHAAGEFVERWGQWEWDRGEIYLNDIEVMYFHFINRKSLYSSLDIWGNYPNLPEVLKLNSFRFDYDGVYA